MFDKDPFKEFDKRHDKMQRQFWAAWWIMALVGIAFTGAIIWAIVRVVLKFT
jgi:hypothetical protein